jgi:hypothetical protein
VATSSKNGWGNQMIGANNMRLFTVFAIGLAAAVAALAQTQSARAQTVSIICATEGQTCTAPDANTTIAFGKNGAVATTIGVTQIGCNNDAFHTDPLIDQSKYCTYSVDISNVQWTKCASEGGRCEFTGARLVRYGATKFVYDSFLNGIDCNNGVFGDPEHKVSKSCFVANH